MKTPRTLILLTGTSTFFDVHKIVPMGTDSYDLYKYRDLEWHYVDNIGEESRALMVVKSMEWYVKERSF